MWKAVISKVTSRNGIYGISDGVEHRIDISQLQTTPKKGDIVKGHRAGGAIIAEHLLSCECENNRVLRELREIIYQIGDTELEERGLSLIQKLQEQIQ